MSQMKSIIGDVPNLHCGTLRKVGQTGNSFTLKYSVSVIAFHTVVIMESPNHSQSEYSSFGFNEIQKQSSTDTSFISSNESGDDETAASSSSSSSSSFSLESLANFIHNNLKPIEDGKYGVYATSYITNVIPNLDYPDSTEQPPPFPDDAIKIKKFEAKEKRIKELGKSLRHEYIIPQSKSILKQITQTSKSRRDHDHDDDKYASEQRLFLFCKARQWCDVNKALYVDQTYPKIGPKVLRQKFSDEHKIACRNLKSSAGLSDKAKIFRPTTIHSFPKPGKEIHNSNSTRESVMKQQICEIDRKQQAILKQELKGIFEDIKPIVDAEPNKCSWQSLAKKTGTANKPSKIKQKPFQKTFRNIYPPITETERIVNLRKQLPPPKPLEMETDYLSGIWQPELEIDEFNITCANNVKEEEVGEDNWFQLHETKEKCWRWLKSIPDI